MLHRGWKKLFHFQMFAAAELLLLLLPLLLPSQVLLLLLLLSLLLLWSVDDDVVVGDAPAVAEMLGWRSGGARPCQPTCGCQY